ncbi:MAG TPA: hypothetical protein V6D08_21205 [Candidatus Obscuribacterales bacterium]
MKGRYLAQASLIATFSLLVFVFSPWMKPLQLQASDQKINEPVQSICVAQTGAVYLAEVKPRIAGFGVPAGSSCTASPRLFQQKTCRAMQLQEVALGSVPRPLWLLNRSLLI